MIVLSAFASNVFRLAFAAMMIDDTWAKPA